MKTILLDKNGNELNNGDFIEIYISEFTDYKKESYYHKGIYKVVFDEIFGVRFIFQSLVVKENDELKENLNQYLSNTSFIINQDIILLHSDRTNLDIFDKNRIIYYNVFVQQNNGVKFNYNNSYITKL